MKLEEAIAITLAFQGGVVVKPRPSKEDQEVIDQARGIVHDYAREAIAATRDAWAGKMVAPGHVLADVDSITGTADDQGGFAGGLETDDPVADALTDRYGGRCVDFEPNCIGCQAWRRYDDLTAKAAKLDDTLPCEVTVVPATRFGKGVTVATVLMALDRRRKEGAAYDEAVTRLNRMTDGEIDEFNRQSIAKRRADVLARLSAEDRSMGPAGLAAAFDQGRLPPVPPASKLNENNSSTAAAFCGCDHEGTFLAEEASQWSGDWCDFALKAEDRLRAAYVAGLEDAAKQADTAANGMARLAEEAPSVEKQALASCAKAISEDIAASIRARIAEMEAKQA